MNHKKCDLTLSKTLIEGLDTEVLKQQSAVADLVLSWIKSLCEARDAWDAKVAYDEEQEAERLRIEAEEEAKRKAEEEKAKAAAAEEEEGGDEE